MLVWLDLETTGLDPKVDSILEVGVIVTDDDLNPIGKSGSWIVKPAFFPPEMSEYVYDMHTASGLLDLVNGDYSNSITVVEKWVIDYIDGCARYLSDNGPWMLAGSTIHFDRSFIRECMPRLEDRLAYRMVDVSSLKELVKRWSPNLEYKIEGEKPHRSLDDLGHTLSELKKYRAAMNIG